jgi:hypothetical protein
LAKADLFSVPKNQCNPGSIYLEATNRLLGSFTG